MSSDISIELLEKSILGTMMEENYLILESAIEVNMFRSPIHQLIYLKMRELAKNNQPVDYMTVLMGVDPEALGGANYISGLCHLANPEKFDAYLQMLTKAWQDHKMRAILCQAQTEEWSFDKVQEKLNELDIALATPDTNIYNDLVEIYELPFKPNEKSDIVPVVIPSLEYLIKGFRNGELTIIAGRPSMGKTDVMNHFALTSGWNGYLPIIFSLEMNRQMLINRLIAATGQINRLKMHDPYQYFTEKQREQWPKILESVHQANIEIDDRAGLSVSQIRAQARKIIKKNPMKKPIIFIDYLQIIYSDLQGNQTNIIGQISWQLKQMAKDFNCPVVCLAQLNRGVESRQMKRPVLSDLRDSGNIEQDADVVMLLYRDSYYQSKDANLTKKDHGKPQTLELIVAKNRNGATGTAYASFNIATGVIGGGIHNNHPSGVQENYS